MRYSSFSLTRGGIIWLWVEISTSWVSMKSNTNFIYNLSSIHLIFDIPSKKVFPCYKIYLSLSGFDYIQCLMKLSSYIRSRKLSTRYLPWSLYGCRKSRLKQFAEIYFRTKGKLIFETKYRRTCMWIHFSTVSPPLTVRLVAARGYAIYIHISIFKTFQYRRHGR